MDFDQCGPLSVHAVMHHIVFVIYANDRTLIENLLTDQQSIENSTLSIVSTFACTMLTWTGPGRSTERYVICLSSFEIG